MWTVVNCTLMMTILLCSEPPFNLSTVAPPFLLANLLYVDHVMAEPVLHLHGLKIVAILGVVARLGQTVSRFAQSELLSWIASIMAAWPMHAVGGMLVHHVIHWVAFAVSAWGEAALLTVSFLSAGILWGVYLWLLRYDRRWNLLYFKLTVLFCALCITSAASVVVGIILHHDYDAFPASMISHVLVPVLCTLCSLYLICRFEPRPEEPATPAIELNHVHKV